MCTCGNNNNTTNNMTTINLNVCISCSLITMFVIYYLWTCHIHCKQHFLSFRAGLVFSLVECTWTLGKSCSWQKLPPKTNSSWPSLHSRKRHIWCIFMCHVRFSWITCFCVVLWSSVHCIDGWNCHKFMHESKHTWFLVNGVDAYTWHGNWSNVFVNWVWIQHVATKYNTYLEHWRWNKFKT